MIVIPAIAFILGGLIGTTARHRIHAQMLLLFAAPVLSMLAFFVQFLPFAGGELCTSTVCRPVPPVAGWSGHLPYLIAIGLVLLSFATVVSFWTDNWAPAAISAVLQCVPQVSSFGGFIDWAPTLVVTIAMAFAMTGGVRTATSRRRSRDRSESSGSARNS
jgi:H+/Cl- antiporter ClcA